MKTTINTLDQLADLINSMDEYNPFAIESICEENGWNTYDDEWNIADDGVNKVMFNDDCEAIIVSIDNLDIDAIAKAEGLNLEHILYDGCRPHHGGTTMFTGFDSWEQAERFAEKHNGTVHSIHKVNGWQWYEDNGTAYEPYNSAEAQCGDNDYIFYAFSYKSHDEFHAIEVADRIEDNPDNEEEITEYYESIWGKLQDIKSRNAEHTECVIAQELAYFDTDCINVEPIKSIHYYYDTHTYSIAVEI